MLLRSRRSPSRRYHVAPSFRGTDSSSEQLERIACAGRGQGGPREAEGLAPERDASTARPTYGPTRNRTENLLIKSQLLCQLSYRPGSLLPAQCSLPCPQGESNSCSHLERVVS